MRRRSFLLALGSAAVAPSLVYAQQPGRVARVVLWMGGLGPSDPQGQRNLKVFQDNLREHGWIDGRNLRVDLRWASPAFSQQDMHDGAAEVIYNPDYIVTTGAPILAALQRHTKNIPIVFTFVTDPVTDGFVASLSRPGSNITGFTLFDHSFAGKWLEMLKEAVPSIQRVAVMQNTGHPAWMPYLRAIEALAPRVGVTVTPMQVNSLVDVEPALSIFAGSPNGGLIVLPSPSWHTASASHRGRRVAPSLAVDLFAKLLSCRRRPDVIWCCKR
jgi:putative tryptophan/tyrosine transport system substrate-binding protein